MTENELYHHGVKGQRWGIRRYQNADGSLTAAGKKKYGTKTNFNKVQAAKKRAATKSKVETARAKANARTQKEIDKYNKKAEKKSGKTNSTPKSKSISEMTDDEIRAKINRIRLENDLKNLQPKQISKGQAFVDGVKEVAIPAIKDASRTQLTKYLNNKLGELMGNDSDGEKPMDKFAKAKRDAEYASNLKKAYADKRDLEAMKAKTAEAKAKKAEEDAKAAKEAAKNAQEVKDAKSAKKAAEREAKEARREAEAARKEADEAKRQAEATKKSDRDSETIYTTGDDVFGKGTSTYSGPKKYDTTYDVEVDFGSSTVSSPAVVDKVQLGRSAYQLLLEDKRK